MMNTKIITATPPEERKKNRNALLVKTFDLFSDVDLITYTIHLELTQLLTKYLKQCT